MNICKKICLLGAPFAGKTSLVRRFVETIYSDAYLATVGVKISKKTLKSGDYEVELPIWDIEGADRPSEVRWSYLKGTSGILLVGDGTRPHTLDAANKIYQRTREEVGVVPFMFLLNKADLLDDWVIDDASITELRRKGWPVVKSSAKSGAGVDEAFLELTQKILGIR
jgi:small GTP-binding protein